MWCFVHLDLEMCFAPQRRALFEHVDFQKWSEHLVLLTVDLEICFAPQRCALCRHHNFQAVRTWYALYALIWTRASRHNGVQLFISHLTTWLRTRRFSEPTF